jgi:hypothetical protein
MIAQLDFGKPLRNKIINKSLGKWKKSLRALRTGLLRPLISLPELQSADLEMTREVTKKKKKLNNE